jgi:branched-chain amino acid transport system permease protein
MAQFGGMMFLSGPIFGAFFLVGVPEFLRIAKGWEPVFFGGAIVLMMLFFPKGAVTLVGQGGAAIFKLFKKARGKDYASYSTAGTE